MTLMGRRALTVIGLLALVGLAVLAFRPAPVLVETARVERGDVRVTIDEEGETRVRDRFVITAPNAGRVARIDLHAGDRVEQGTVVARMNPLPLDPRSRAEAAARLDAARRPGVRRRPRSIAPALHPNRRGDRRIGRDDSGQSEPSAKRSASCRS